MHYFLKEIDQQTEIVITIGQAIKAPQNASIILHTVASCLEMGRGMPL
jgi:hypothetical protein